MSRQARSYAFRGWLLLTAACAAVISLGGAAFAYVHSSGSGAGTASTRNAINITINAATASNDLFPGHTGSIEFTLTNTNPYTANFSSVTAASVTSGSPSGCPPNNITVATLPYSISTITVASGQTTATQTLSGLISMSSAAPTTCQGVSFTVSLTLSGHTN